MDTLSEKPAGLAETDCDRKVKLNDHEDETDYKMHEAILAEAMEDSASPELSAEVRLRNPLLGYSPAQIEARVQDFVSNKGLEEYHELFLKGAFCAQAQSTGHYDKVPYLTSEDHEVLAKEKTKKWHQPFILYWLAICCLSLIHI